jgi:hypothetical protein
MAKQFRTRFFKLGKWFAGLFLLLFLFRLAFGYTTNNTSANGDIGGDFFSSLNNLRKNYASEKVSMKVDGLPTANNIPFSNNQKFEKTASVRTQTSRFESDEKLLRQQVKAYDALIQYEQNLGKTGARELHLLIGVPPMAFDSFYTEIQKIGAVRTQEITKVDKTNEYRQLNARKASLEKTLQSLNELKSRGGQITDFVSLHDKILETETKMQELGVELGNFDTENEFCTVRLSMYEGRSAKGVSFFYRVKVALEWTLKYYAFVIFILLCLSITLFLFLLIVEKLKILKSISARIDE